MKTAKYKGFNVPLGSGIGEGIKTPKAFIESGIEQVSFLAKRNLLDEHSNILDFGCGVGRFWLALKFAKIDFNEYVGIDTKENCINWCKENLDKDSFLHLPAHNARYNKSASGLQELPFKENIFDLIFLNSVFSHMLLPDILFYLDEFKKVITDDGVIYCTGFFEKDGADFEENPKDYMNKKTRGSLHRVVYNVNYLREKIKEHGFTISEFHYRGIKRTGQSVLLLTRTR